MDSEYVIEVNNLIKGFKVYLDKGTTIKEKIVSKSRRKYEKREVLNGISFSVKRGEAIGLIGHNGCGKSTTLKLLTRIMYPDSGTITMNGRVSSLIELGAGFHPDMSGRENIYINASIFGLSKREIDRRLDDIIAFSELEEFIDNPIRTYSSGMYMRLAFSVAINVDADILLVDEILAVGDVNFQEKCFERLREIKSQGVTIVIVSHALGQIEQICDRTLWIDCGKIRAEGVPRDVHAEYLDYMNKKRRELTEKEQKGVEPDSGVFTDKDVYGKRQGNGKIRIHQVQMLDVDGKVQISFRTGEVIEIHVSYTVRERVDNVVFGVGIFRSDGLQCYGTNTRIDQVECFNIGQDGTIILKLLDVSLLSGKYVLDIVIESGRGEMIDCYKEAVRFEVYSEINDIGIMRIKHNWILVRNPENNSEE